MSDFKALAREAKKLQRRLDEMGDELDALRERIEEAEKPAPKEKPNNDD